MKCKWQTGETPEQMAERLSRERVIDTTLCDCECCSRPVVPWRLEYPQTFPAWWIDEAVKRIERSLNYDPNAWKDDHARFLLECRNERNKTVIDRALARLFGDKP